MDKIEIRGVINFFLEGKTAKEIHGSIAHISVDSCPSYETVRFWVNEFKRSRKSIEDELHHGTLKSAVTPDATREKFWLSDSLKSYRSSNTYFENIFYNRFAVLPSELSSIFPWTHLGCCNAFRGAVS